MKLTYEERLSRYEQEKKLLQQQNLTSYEYTQEIKRLADKWKV